jgi:thiamine transport system ATP-binding protein
VAANIALGLDPRARLNAAQRARVGEVLADIGLGGFERRLPGQLSGGQRQRVALARSLLRDKPVMLLDEPFSALDEETRDEMAALVRRLARERGLAVLVVSHDPADARRLGSRAITLCNGTIR